LTISVLFLSRRPVVVLMSVTATVNAFEMAAVNRQPIEAGPTRGQLLPSSAYASESSALRLFFGTTLDAACPRWWITRWERLRNRLVDPSIVIQS
jgi:hypothetical protein